MAFLIFFFIYFLYWRRPCGWNVYFAICNIYIILWY